MKCFLILIMLLLNLSSNVHARELGLFWKLNAPNGSTHYLFGTIHSDDNKIVNFLPIIKKSLNASDLLLVEITPGGHSQNLFLKDYSLLPFLNELELSQVRMLSEFHVMFFENVIRMKPWLLAIIFDSPRPHTEFNQDYLLMAMAAELDKEVLGIESSQEHFATMDSLSLDEQLMMLRAVLKKTEKEKISDYNLLMKDYLSSNLDQVRKTDERLTSKLLTKVLWAKVKVQLMDERNKKMVAKINALSIDKQLFIAVGASHLSGQDGLINQLRKLGFKISPLKAFD